MKDIPKTFGWTPPDELRSEVWQLARQMYNKNLNATITLLVMRGLGKGDYEIEQVAKYWMRKGAGAQVLKELKNEAK